MTEAEFDSVMEVNVKGVFAVTRFAAQAMKDGGGGKIVSVVSNSGLRGGFGQTNYAASKAGVAGMIRTWALELERYNIQVNGLWPVAVTDMTRVIVDRERAAAETEGREPLTAKEIGLGEVAEVAPIVVFLASDLCELHGQILTCNGTKIALWSHPNEITAAFRDHWTVDEIKQSMDAQFAHFFQTVGSSLA
jgi:NAD(P)-dependent dehydrogenase (short-subunit alcohol dehydrogenase family)